MRRLTMLMTILATAAAFSSASAAFNSDRVSVDLTAGAAVNLSSGDHADLFPSAFTATGNLYYLLNEHVSIVPLALVWHVYNYDQMNNATTQGVVNSLPEEVRDTPVGGLDIKGSAWGVGLLPGLHFESAGDRLIDFNLGVKYMF